MKLFKSKVAPSEISDDDFPAMPMRKGENRLVVSKNQDRSLTSPKYKRQASMDQASNANFVPFVPFPPGYFARKDSDNPNGPNPPASTAVDTPLGKTEAEDKQPMGSANSQLSSRIAAPPTGNPVDSGLSKNENPNQGSWTGTSLEGSAVTEPDPLDMSEEAKAERWFKLVAQIKDISELSQIPDENFPSIMPMRKGVNRFVVSKRKTPLERRLTSQQYRRNLPIVRTDPPAKKEGDDS